MNISPSPFAPENLVSRDGYGSLVSRQPAHLHTQAEWHMVTQTLSRTNVSSHRLYIPCVRGDYSGWGLSSALYAYHKMLKRVISRTCLRESGRRKGECERETDVDRLDRKRSPSVWCGGRTTSRLGRGHRRYYHNKIAVEKQFVNVLGVPGEGVIRK